MVNYRLVAIGRRPTLTLPKVTGNGTGGATSAFGRRQVYFDDAETPVDCPVYDRMTLAPGTRIAGPALVQEYASTTVIFEADSCTVADTGELIIAIGRDS